ncbi:sigma-54-dependent transcriptional regulator [Paraburkholderia phytofirmans]|uniref:Two component, sigma54 specific, transcriptional regulator, Fis family n=1 Tax=Paraburkholderia phytofirmans (strain DSM 17436 / LMG 22146 / PsJN) TaxID=398527 RepID=B2TAP1_PARPJ|nr:sigma-54 dependent transcriptional regulator [Paraburkholderia phytofirmans]ACD20391.1 two component, sigma54 specific, transcriptional regulator, Fis family [Paraburkholderia phytofirmans PsJN]
MAHILVVDDDDGFREGLVETLVDLGHSVEEASSGEQALGILTNAAVPFTCMFLDFRLPGMDGLAILEALQTTVHGPTLPVVMLTGFASSDNTIGAMTLGAFDHLTKPVGRQAIQSLLERIVSSTAAGATSDEPLPKFAAEPASTKPRLLGVSETLREVQKQIGRAASSDATVLLSGETGTGKEVAAHVLHDASKRRDKPFVAVNCAAIPSELLESELFGHVKGAFTGASADRAGCFAAADGGTLLLDEVGDMPLPMQAKLLRVIQERQITPLGSSRVIPVDIRLVAATHRDLKAMVEAGEFREDLLYRLNIIPIELPPLRERLADILPLAEHFLAEVAIRRSRGMRLSSPAQRLLLGYAWPGNVRELRNAIERAGALAPGPSITAEDLGFLNAKPNDGQPLLNASFFDMSLPGAVEAVERAMISHALRLADNNRADAARRLGISRQTLYAKLAALKLE